MKFSAVIQKVTPWIATAASLAPIPGAPLIAMAAKALSTGLSTDVKPDPSAIETAITTAMANPDQLATLKKIDDDFAVQMKQLGIQELEDLAKIAADDTANARAREIALKDRVPALLALFVTLGFFGVLTFMLLKSVPDSQHDALMLMLGVLGTAWTSVVAYYFGSSAGSAAKTALMAQNGNGGK